jgi:Aerotolerance regulator N-terminal/von Willebrand factor type A domain
VSFLAPLFLLGGAAVVAPILFHLIRRSTRRRTVFGSLMFLTPSPPPRTRRRRLENWLLLLLRCLALMALALAFTRPFFRRTNPDPSTAAPARRRVVLLDVSASMRRGSLGAEARAKALAAARAAQPGDQLQFMTFARRVETVLSFAEWNAASVGERSALAAARLGAVEPGWTSTRLGDALTRAAEALAAVEGPGLKDVLLVSDLQEGARLEGLQGFEWPKGVGLSVDPVRLKRGNAGLLWAPEEATKGVHRNHPRVRVLNTADNGKDQFMIRWSGDKGLSGSMSVYVPAGQSRVFAIPAGTNGPGPSKIELVGDDEPFDNTLFLAPRLASPTTILYFGDESPTNARAPLFFLKNALADTAGRAFQVVASPSSGNPTDEEWARAALFVMTRTPSSSALARLREKTMAGRTVIAVATDSSLGPALSTLSGIGGVALEEAVAGDATLGDIDFRHPLFAPFADPKYSDFTKVHFWRHQRLTPSAPPQARIIARFDQGDPAVLELPVGKGRVILVTSGWHPADSQLALSSKFVPLLYSLIDVAGAAEPAPAQYFTGDSVAVPTGLDGPVTLRMPDGSSRPVESGATKVDLATTPGLYAFEAGGLTRVFAVNLDPAESRTSPVPVDDLERLGAPSSSTTVAPPASAAGAAVTPADQEGRQKLWRPLLVAALVVLAGESLLAGRIVRGGGTEQMEAA